MVGEIKVTYTEAGDRELQGIYQPVVEAHIGQKVLCLQVFKHFKKGCMLPVLENVSDLYNGEYDTSTISYFNWRT